MRKIALLMAAAFLAGCAVDTLDAGKLRQELEAANAGYDRALIAGDAAALGKYYTDDFSIIDDDANLRGKAEQVRLMTETIDLIEARSDDVSIDPLGADAALLTGRFTGRYRMDGEENAFSERYTSVWVRDGGAWKVRHEHASLVPKIETPAAE